MAADTISVCLPKGDAMAPLAAYLDDAGFPVREYHSKNRTYRPPVDNLPVRAKIMAEKDVAIQVSVGNYDIGFCGMDWIMELVSKYRGSEIQVFKKLGLDKKGVYACTGTGGEFSSAEDLHSKKDFVSIVSEYPNLAEHFAVKNRLRKFKIFSAWGSVEAYPPEHADVVILGSYDPDSFSSMGLVNIGCQLESELSVVVNRKSFVQKGLSPVLRFFSENQTKPGA